MHTSLNIAITLFVFSGQVIYHACQIHFSPLPLQAFLNCNCVCYSKRDERGAHLPLINLSG